ncbi:MAG: PAS domain S-box protein [Kiritimatiellae bacterium]|nr:PAS domain S-box protein [Kiritimatiellia bacterium]
MNDSSLLPVVVVSALLFTVLTPALLYLLNQRLQLLRGISRISLKKKALDQELTRLQQKERNARHSEQWLRQLFDNSKEMVFVHSITEKNLPGAFIEVNKVFCDRLNYPRRTLMEMNPMDIEFAHTVASSIGYTQTDMVVLSDKAIQKHRDKLATRPAKRLMQKILKEKIVSYETVFDDKNGNSILVEVEARLIDVSNQKAIMCTAHDISEQKETEIALHESNRRFNDFFMHSPIGIAIYDARRELIDINRSCLKMFATSDPMQFSAFNLFNNPFIPEPVKAQIQRGENVRYELCLDFDNARQRMALPTTRTGTAYFDVIISNMGPDKDFHPRGYFAQVQDITARRKAERDLQNNEKHLRQAAKMEAIGSLASGIAHDFNNILTPIVGYAELTMRTNKDNPAIKKCMAGIIKASGRAKELVSQILSHCRTDNTNDQELAPTLVTPIIKEVLVLQKKALPENVSIKRVLKANHDTVMSNATKLHQVFMNICTNAGHAMRNTDSGTLELTTTNFVLERRTRSKHPDLSPGKYLQISIRDTGTGMPETTAERIFEPFFTTKKKGEGTGMGLSVVHGIIRAFRGSITVETEVGKGTLFNILLPTIEQPAVIEQFNIDEELLRGNEHILIVDDEEDIIDVTQRSLESLGYQVSTAESAQKAMYIFSQDPSAFNLVITDQVMSDITGDVMAREMLSLRPDIPIILYTGFPENFSEKEAKDIGIKEFLLKPITAIELSKALRRQLDP